MKRLAICAVLAVTSVMTHARDIYAPTGAEVLRELSRRSGLPEPDLKKTTADCAANQVAIYFCGYRDAVAAEMKLRHAVDERSRRYPGCKAEFEDEVENWKKDMVAGCRKIAAEDYGGGSMEPAAAVLCQASSTEQMAKTIARRRGCKVPEP
jgi:hypothetical protein